MAYRLRHSESAADGIRRVIREEVHAAAAGLRELSDSQTAVHEARKSVKKVRALLRLISPKLREPFGAANVALRDASRRLSHLRDADVMVETLDALVQRFPEADLAELRLKLLAGRKSAPKRTAASVAREMEQAVAALAEWPVDDTLSGLEATYRKGRAALVEAGNDPTVESLHGLRKRVKDHWYHLRLIEPLWNDVLRAREKNLKSIETWLGDNHNLAVLEQRQPQLKEMVEQFRRELETSALELSKSLYVEKPRLFAAHIHELWDAWKARPSKRAA